MFPAPSPAPVHWLQPRPAHSPASGPAPPILPAPAPPRSTLSSRPRHARPPASSRRHAPAPGSARAVSALARELGGCESGAAVAASAPAEPRDPCRLLLG